MTKKKHGKRFVVIKVDHETNDVPHEKVRFETILSAVLDDEKKVHIDVFGLYTMNKRERELADKRTQLMNDYTNDVTLVSYGKVRQGIIDEFKPMAIEAIRKSMGNIIKKTAKHTKENSVTNSNKNFKQQ